MGQTLFFTLVSKGSPRNVFAQIGGTSCSLRLLGGGGGPVAAVARCCCPVGGSPSARHVRSSCSLGSETLVVVENDGELGLSGKKGRSF